MNRALILFFLVISFSLSVPLAAQSKPAPTQKQSVPAKSPPAAAPSAPKPTTDEAQPQLSVAPNAPVIVLNGVCATEPPPANCATTVSRAEFDKLVAAFAPNSPPSARRKMANEYVRLLAMANEGRKIGADKTPAFEQQLQTFRLRMEAQLELEKLNLLAQSAAQQLKDSLKPTEQAIEAYYTENSSQFEELQLRRIFIPKSNNSEIKTETVKALADKIHERAVAGEDPDKLETEAYLASKAPGAPPSTNIGWKRRGTIDPRWQSQISALKAGAVSEVLEDPQGYSIYKVESKRMVPLQTVSKDIEGKIQGQRFQEKIQQLTGSVKADLNEVYFGPAEEAPQDSPAKPPSLQRQPEKK